MSIIFLNDRKVSIVLQPLTDDRNAYEISIYNRDVRPAVKCNQSHILFGDHWADLKIQDVHAQSETEARKLISRRYLPEQGFVIEELTALG